MNVSWVQNLAKSTPLHWVLSKNRESFSPFIMVALGDVFNNTMFYAAALVIL
jgi:hypothetical protein